ncbi:hypothetical protein BDZ89DRAFT_1067497 [Hymenopellis radicata]|nr:hypothetical protein BDZ89DRAFT_1067497 [Hymenopellis radicata]
MAGDELLSIPDIPVDIVHLILETLAIMSRPDALRLVLVSKAVRKWIDVILYHSVTIVSSSQFYAFLRAIKSRAEAGETSFFAVTVKYLFLQIPMDAIWARRSFDALRVEERTATISAFVSACSGLVALGLRDGTSDASFLTAVLDGSPALRLKRLSLFWGPNDTFKHLPPTLTHLRYPCGTLPLNHLRTAPLTHLHVDVFINPLDNRWIVEIKQVIEAMPSTIQMCIFSLIGDHTRPEELNGILDPRVAILGILDKDLARHGSSWSELSRDCGFLPDGHLDSWEIFAKLVKEREEDEWNEAMIPKRHI